MLEPDLRGGGQGVERLAGRDAELGAPQIADELQDPLVHLGSGGERHLPLLIEGWLGSLSCWSPRLRLRLLPRAAPHTAIPRPPHQAARCGATIARFVGSARCLDRKRVV